MFRLRPRAAMVNGPAGADAGLLLGAAPGDEHRDDEARAGAARRCPTRRPLRGSLPRRSTRQRARRTTQRPRRMESGTGSRKPLTLVRTVDRSPSHCPCHLRTLSISVSTLRVLSRVWGGSGGVDRWAARNRAGVRILGGWCGRTLLCSRSCAAAPNVLWQADHTLLDLWLRDTGGADTAGAGGTRTMGRYVRRTKPTAHTPHAV